MDWWLFWFIMWLVMLWGFVAVGDLLFRSTKHLRWKLQELEKQLKQAEQERDHFHHEMAQYIEQHKALHERFRSIADIASFKTSEPKR